MRECTEAELNEIAIENIINRKFEERQKEKDKQWTIETIIVSAILFLGWLPILWV